jgi:hypothetical protein
MNNIRPICYKIRQKCSRKNLTDEKDEIYNNDIAKELCISKYYKCSCK